MAETNPLHASLDVVPATPSTPVFLADPQNRLPDWLEQVWLERYLLRLLDEPERDWFETYVLCWPHLVAELEADEALRAALATLPAAAITATEPGAAVPIRPSGSASRRWSRRLFPLAAAAAGFAGALVLAPMLLRTPLPAISDPPRYVFDVVRGDRNEPYTERGNAASDYVIVELAMPPDVSRVKVSVPSGSGRRVLLEALQAGPEGYATVLLSRADFAKARATLFLANNQQRQIELAQAAAQQNPQQR